MDSSYCQRRPKHLPDTEKFRQIVTKLNITHHAGFDKSNEVRENPKHKNTDRYLNFSTFMCHFTKNVFVLFSITLTKYIFIYSSGKKSTFFLLLFVFLFPNGINIWTQFNNLILSEVCQIKISLFLYLILISIIIKYKS